MSQSNKQVQTKIKIVNHGEKQCKTMGPWFKQHS